MRAFYAAAMIIALFSTSPARADSSPIVFQKDAESCYRIPSLAQTASGYLAVVEHRHGIFGQKTCNDDGTIDLVGKTSANGESWSEQHVIVSSEKFGEALASPSSPIYDPAFAGVSKDMRLVRVGNQGLVAKGNDAYLLFVGQYNTEDSCGDDSYCVNSPENLRAGHVKARYFLTRSTDGGRSWSAPVRVHSEIYGACTDQLIKDEGLKSAVKRLFVDDRKLSASAYQTYMAVAETLVGGQPDPEGAAQALKVSTSAVRANLKAMQLLFLPAIRVGPGNGVAFPKGAGTRLVFAAAPFNIISDDGGAKFQCGNTTTITRSGERQVAWLGGDTLLMTLRLKGNVPSLKDVRLFSVSKDGGFTWSEDKPIIEDGKALMPDSIAQASIVGINDTNPPMAMHFNLAKPDNAVARNNGKRKKRPAVVRMDRRNTLSAVRLYLEPSGLVPATTNGCEPAGNGDNVAYKVIWPGSAAYSAAVYSEKQKAVGLLFEASDDDGPALAYRAWNEAVRFTKIPVSEIKGTAPSAQACTK